MRPSDATRRQRGTVIVALLLFNLVLILLQLWLFVSVLEGLIGGRSGMALPAAVASVALFGVNIWMLRGVTMPRIGQ